MLSATEERSPPVSDRQAMERNLRDVHRILDEYEVELAAGYGRARRGSSGRPVSSWESPPKERSAR
jgi:hypothetical protein